MNKQIDEFEKAPVKFLIKCVILAIIVVCLITVITLPFTTCTSIATKTFNADNVVYNYEYFKLQYESIKAMKTKIHIAEKDVLEMKAIPRTELTFEDKTEYSRLKSISTGLKYQLEDMVADYNAKSKMINRSIFKEGVPQQTNSNLGGMNSY